jgi:hypothetical protein
LKVFSFGYALIGIGTSRPDALALLDVFSTTKPILLPPLTMFQREAIVYRTVILLLFNTTIGGIDTYVGKQDGAQFRCSNWV